MHDSPVLLARQIIEGDDYETIEAIIRHVIEDAPLECTKWGAREDGIIGRCKKCIACKIMDVLD